MDESVNKASGSVQSGNRWVKEEWRSFELYEKARVRVGRKRLAFIALSVLLFLGLCSIPVIQERAPKWNSLRIARDLSVEIEKLKTLAIKNKKPARLIFNGPNLLEIDLVGACPKPMPVKLEPSKPEPVPGAETPESQKLEPTKSEAALAEKPEPIFTKQWTADEPEFKILSAAEAHEYSIALVEDGVCFDPVDGLISKYNKVVIAIVPVKDLAEKRLDRASYVIIEGESAKVTLN